MTMRTAPWRPTKRRDEEEASTSGRDAREIVNDLVPLEHFSRVIRGRAREGGSETCALGTRGWVAKEGARRRRRRRERVDATMDVDERRGGKARASRTNVSRA